MLVYHISYLRKIRHQNSKTNTWNLFTKMHTNQRIIGRDFPQKSPEQSIVALDPLHLEDHHLPKVLENLSLLICLEPSESPLELSHLVLPRGQVHLLCREDLKILVDACYVLNENGQWKLKQRPARLCHPQ